MTDCCHAFTEFGRVVFRGGGFHLVERCKVCHANVRGAGVWVARSEVPDPESLPAFGDSRTAEERGEQPLLFEP